MRRFAIAAVLAAILGLGLADTANAQYVQRYTTITPRGGVATGGYLYGPGVVQSYNTYVSPFGTVRRQAYYGDIFGNNYGVSNGYNAFSGYGYNSGYYRPSPLMYPYPGYSYNFYRRW